MFFSALAGLTTASPQRCAAEPGTTWRVFKDKGAAYDLDQLPTGRPRRAHAGAPLFGLTAHTRQVWSPGVDRCLRRSELAASMGIPSHLALAIEYGMTEVSFDHLSRSAAARLIGKGMSIPCVGAILVWCSGHCIPEVVDLPATLSDPEVSPSKIQAIPPPSPAHIVGCCSTAATTGANISHFATDMVLVAATL